MQNLQPNTTLLGGKYRIERVLGQGGFGITYLAVQTSLNRYVAIKELFIGGSGQAINDRRGNLVVVTNSANQQSFNQQREKFKKEASRLANLKHPNLVKVHELFEENGTAYYVMDYIDGESLRTKINRGGKLSESLVLKYIKQILPALKVAHKQSIWHLDIKPENIMVDRNDNAYLIDFGASKHIERSGTLTTSLALAYTPGYCAQELTDLLNESEDGFADALREIGPWTDIYSIGATMYNLLTDSIPPSSKKIERNGRNAFSFPSDVTSSTKDMVVKMMKPNRYDRPHNVKALLNSLNPNKETSSSNNTGLNKGISEQTLENIAPLLSFIGIISAIILWIYSINHEPSKYDFRLYEWFSKDWFNALGNGLYGSVMGGFGVFAMLLILIEFVAVLVKPNRLTGKLLLLLGVFMYILLFFVDDYVFSINVWLFIIYLCLPGVLIGIGIKKL